MTTGKLLEIFFGPFSDICYPFGSEASWEVANLTERKNLHTPIYGVKEFVRLFVLITDNNIEPLSIKLNNLLSTCVLLA